ncbi:uncharacterized protein K444DRAFT_409486 [Hyaloscypha bicolor E]|uniref:Uncharacterized protein n=1 Tax=Hyaloscypha bicolor E TaxID=1095630 RepID=A0A2J6T9T5_9HELO|nr:uncharacterized protein K444DRAFT_409486 [Hyaloscypha bicolor E]PMD59752.1 hypothetical protein K444DRAFT_409486 [Hyaloscypha bicolor E]
MINDHPMIPALPSSALLSAPAPWPPAPCPLLVRISRCCSRPGLLGDRLLLYAYLSRAVAAQGALQTSGTAVVVLVELL